VQISRRSLLKGAVAAGGLAALGPRVARADLGLNTNSPVDHIVVVMMENRSFDHLLGWVPGAAGYRVVAPDQRGYSAGARPAQVERYALPALVGDVIAIADALGGHRFHLVGHDWGAAVAWQVAGRHQDRLRSLTILSVPHPKAFGRALSGEDGADQSARSSYIDFFRSDGAAEAFTQNGGEGLRNLYAMTGLTDVEPYVERLLEPGAMQAALNWYRAASLTDVDALGEITMPTMFVWSTEDAALGPDAAHWTEEYVAGPYHFEVLEGIGHWIAESAPDRLNALLVEHLGSAG
jgi:pimeloyl-ACP methyl ester carboxylesterase